MVAYHRRDEFEYGRTAHLHLDALLVPVQIIFSSIHSPSHILIPFFVLCRIGPLIPRLDIPLWIRAEEEYFQDQDFYSQSGYSFVDQSRG
ncbi:hypothetical protein CK203_051916 [Vitis vinifera]|uniref:Uncharacterized protein n=1 Tax=Vitis vinifera TaxID=29760 RepID=A0A438GTF6_VITVI|nr:hypothetical protein CK203_051916 [Vitis vinifera]